METIPEETPMAPAGEEPTPAQGDLQPPEQPIPAGSTAVPQERTLPGAEEQPQVGSEALGPRGSQLRRWQSHHPAPTSPPILGRKIPLRYWVRLRHGRSVLCPQPCGGDGSSPSMVQQPWGVFTSLLPPSWGASSCCWLPARPAVFKLQFHCKQG